MSGWSMGGGHPRGVVTVLVVLGGVALSSMAGAAVAPAARPVPNELAGETDTLASGRATALDQSLDQSPDQSPEQKDRRLLVVVPKTEPKALEATVRALGEEYRLRRLTAWDLRALAMRCVVFEASLRHDLSELLVRLDQDPRVHLAQTVQRFTTHQDPLAVDRAMADGAPGHESAPPDLDPGTRPKGDPYRRLQHALVALRLGAVHRYATGEGVRVAIIDTGIDADHPDLEGRVSVQRDLTGSGQGGAALHGTAVAGVIAAGANAIGILGVAPRVELLSLAACWPEHPGSRRGICDSLTLAIALDTALHLRADIVNLSLGGPPDPLLTELVQAALGRGLVVVAADDGQGSFPARLEGVLGVGMLEPAHGGTRASTTDPSVVFAPGLDILSTVPGGGYDFFTGVSLATAQVAGIGALLRQMRPELDTTSVATLLRETSRARRRDTACEGPCIERCVDVCAALTRAVGGRSSTETCDEPRLASAP